MIELIFNMLIWFVWRIQFELGERDLLIESDVSAIVS